ncbi:MULTISPECIES: hypothetical protein [unclassified Flavobacterium]|uniref:hypothetical protein n=1 Tax=unclassified Flavobacterium TaxID=196869 RepID=UPI003F8EDEC2
MGYMKYTPYIYLIFGLYFIYDGIAKWNEPDATPILSLLIASVAIFMFFFRRNFAKRMEDRKNKS